jgi:stringent starvation protein B
MGMSSSRPYFIRAVYEWIVDNQLTPQILVSVHSEGVLVPQEYVKDGQITLNISPSAVKNYQVEQNVITFTARFRGMPCDIAVPTGAVLGIYARENGQGMMFEQVEDSPPPNGGSEPSSIRSRRPNLRVIK